MEKDELNGLSYSDIEIGKRYLDEFLAHGDWEEHKYIAKVRRPNGKYRYFYDEEEYAAFLSNLENQDQSPEGFDILGLLSDFVLEPLDWFFNDVAIPTVQKGVDFVANLAGGFVSNLFSGKKEEKKHKHKYIAKVELPNGKYRYFYDAGEYANYVLAKICQAIEPPFMKQFDKIGDDKLASTDPLDESLSLVEINAENRNERNSDNYGDDQFGNCLSCTMAYELRKRGYDVVAADRKKLGFFEDTATKRHAEGAFVGGEFEKIDYSDGGLFEAIAKSSPPGSRGNLVVDWKDVNYGHSMAYEVDRDGTVRIIDAQTTDVYADSSEDGIQGSLVFSEESLESRISSARIMRTDNLQLTEDILDYVEKNPNRS